MFIFIFIIILAVLVFVHELGHFWAAKKSGIKVEEFAIGFPPTIFSKKFKETIYKLNIIPFGGYVKIFGEDPNTDFNNLSDEEKNRNFQYKSKLTQIFVLVGGVLMNILFAFILIWISYMIGTSAPESYSKYSKVSNPVLTITSVLPDSPAFKAGLKTFDHIIFAESSKGSIGGDISPEKITELISKSDKLTFSVKRNNQNLKIEVETKDNIVLGKKAIGVSLDTIGTLKLPLHKAFIQAVLTTKDMLLSITSGIFRFISGAFSSSSIKDVSGPIGIARVVKEASSLGFIFVLNLTALISLNLAVLNLIPFPALDGGRILFVILEAVFRRKINPNILNWVNGLGFALLIILMILVTVKDVKGLF